MNKELEEVVEEYRKRENFTINLDNDKLLVIKSDEFSKDISEVQVGVTHSGFLDVRPIGYHEAFDKSGNGAITFIDKLTDLD